MAEPFSAVACGALQLAIRVKENLDQMDDNTCGVDVLKQHVACLRSPLQIIAAMPAGTPLQDSIRAIVELAQEYLEAVNIPALDVRKMSWPKQFLWSRRIAQRLQVVNNNLQSALQSITLHFQVHQQGQQALQHQAVMQQLAELGQNGQLAELKQTQQMLGADAARDEPAHALAVVSGIMEARGLGIRQAQADIDSAMGQEEGYEDKQVSESSCAAMQLLSTCLQSLP
jgi:hypothetical protein